MAVGIGYSKSTYMREKIAAVESSDGQKCDLLPVLNSYTDAIINKNCFSLDRLSVSQKM